MVSSRQNYQSHRRLWSF